MALFVSADASNYFPPNQKFFLLLPRGLVQFASNINLNLFRNGFKMTPSFEKALVRLFPLYKSQFTKKTILYFWPLGCKKIPEAHLS
ncbi:MAG: hypothetical protein ACRYFX_08525 [Janthinobacterium lividum]